MHSSWHPSPSREYAPLIARFPVRKPAKSDTLASLPALQPLNDLVVDAVDGRGEVGVLWPGTAAAEDDFDLVKLVVGLHANATTASSIRTTSVAITNQTRVMVMSWPRLRTANGVLMWGTPMQILISSVKDPIATR